MTCSSMASGCRTGRRLGLTFSIGSRAPWRWSDIDGREMHAARSASGHHRHPRQHVCVFHPGGAKETVPAGESLAGCRRGHHLPALYPIHDRMGLTLLGQAWPTLWTAGCCCRWSWAACARWPSPSGGSTSSRSCGRWQALGRRLGSCRRGNPCRTCLDSAAGKREILHVPRT